MCPQTAPALLQGRGGGLQRLGLGRQLGGVGGSHPNSSRARTAAQALLWPWLPSRKGVDPPEAACLALPSFILVLSVDGWQGCLSPARGLPFTEEEVDSERGGITWATGALLGPSLRLPDWPGLCSGIGAALGSG